MKHKIHSQSGRVVDVTLDDENGLSIRKKMELIKYGTDVVEKKTVIDEKTGKEKVVEVTKLITVDPFDDIGAFFDRYLEAYKQGKEKEAQDNDVPALPLEEECFHSPQVQEAAE